MELRSGIYEHYKGGLCQALGIGEHTETGERLVVYISLKGPHYPGPAMRVRPAAMFFEEVLWPSGERAPRFRYIGTERPSDN